MKLKKGDNVQVLKGKDKGKKGKIARVYPAWDKVLVEGVNQYKRHFKAKVQNQKSEIITLTRPLLAANVVLICPKCKKMTQVKYTIIEKEKYRICKKCKEKI